jgi:hypothetical protein
LIENCALSVCGPSRHIVALRDFDRQRGIARPTCFGGPEYEVRP